MKRLAVIPCDPAQFYLDSGYTAKWLEDYYNPKKFFDEVYCLSPRERNRKDFLGMTTLKTEPSEFKAKLSELKVDIVRAYGGFEPCDLACGNKVPGSLVIVSVHDMNPAFLYDSIRHADVVFCMSNGVRDLVLKKFKKPERAWVLPNRVDFQVMRPYPKEACADLDRKYPFRYKVIHVGRKTEQKNLDNLIKALKILGPDYCVLAVGKGDTEKYAELAKNEGVLERCFFMDAIANDELARYFSWADCMCTPSRYEGFGIVFIEALACEAVVVTSDIVPMTEYITSSENGILVKDYEDPEALARAVASACKDADLRAVIKARARKSVERFQKEKVDALEVEYYQRAMKIGPSVLGFAEKFYDRAQNKLSKIKKRLSA